MTATRGVNASRVIPPLAIHSVNKFICEKMECDMNQMKKLKIHTSFSLFFRFSSSQQRMKCSYMYF